jgi:hypothetical protein
MATFEIPAYNMGRLVEKMGKMQRKAEKLGVVAPQYRVVERVERERVHDVTQQRFPYTAFVVEVEGIAPRLSGWHFVAKVEPTEHGNIVKLMPEVESVPTWAYTRGMDCDHCGKQRGRKEVFIVANDKGEFVQVGRQCLADFLGGVSPETLAARAEWDMALRELGEDRDWFGSGRGEHVEAIEGFVATVCAVARLEGYVSATEAKADQWKDATAYVAWRMTWDSEFTRKFAERYTGHSKGEFVTDEDLTRAKAALAWARGIDAGTNNYLINLRTACMADYVKEHTYGFVASVVQAYRKAMEREVERAVEVGQASEFVGVVGGKIGPIAVTIAYVKECDTAYGVSTLIKMKDEHGNDLTWFASGYHNWEVGTKATLSGTVKKHETYRDAKQTLVTRCKLMEVK